MKKSLSIITICSLSGAAGFLSMATPSIAQSTDEEIIVSGRYGSSDNLQTLSQAVSYSDLDLSTASGKSEFKHRLNLTARYLCDKLGETDTSSTGPIPSCRDAAVKDAMSRAGTLEAHFAPRGTTWASGPAWRAPYPDTWATTYP